MKILIIEDEYNLADAIASMLKSSKYLVDIDTDGETGLDNALSGIYDLIILDVMLPHLDGFTILKELRKENIQTKIIMLTAKNSINDKMIGFNNGADDYLTKPFHMNELLARVNIQLRKDNNHLVTNYIEVNDLKLDISKMKLTNTTNNLSIDIIGKEFQLLELFLKNSKQIIPKEQIFTKIWGYDTNCEINNLEAYISFLRKKLNLIKSKTKIKAIRGVGYKLEVENEKIKD